MVQSKKKDLQFKVKDSHATLDDLLLLFGWNAMKIHDDHESSAKTPSSIAFLLLICHTLKENSIFIYF